MQDWHGTFRSSEEATLSTLDATQATPATRPLRIGVGSQISYGIGQIAGQIFREVPSLLLLFFMTNTLGIGPALAGTAIFVPKLIWGVLCDVGVGVLSDRWKQRMARRWWLVIGAVGAPIALVLLFHVPALDETGKALYIALIFGLYMMVFATFSVPYLAIASEMATDPHERTIIMSWRLVFTAVGVLIADSFSPIYIQTQGGGQPAYESLSHILAVVCPIALVVAFFGARRIASSRAVAASAPIVRVTIRQAWSALAAPRFSTLLIANLFQLVGQGMAFASMLYFFSYNMGRSDPFVQIGLITMIACAAIILAQPLWVALAKRWGKKRVYVISSLLYTVTMITWGLTGPTWIGLSYGFAFLLGLSNSGFSLMGFSMVSDIGGDGKAGLYSSVWVAADKLGFALGGTLLTGITLSLFGFDAARAVAGLSQPPSAMIGTLFGFAILPGLASAVAAGIYGVWGADTEKLGSAV
jgi:GPH family glycoside/pentoside/hexuronide:cation symporter